MTTTSFFRARMYTQTTRKRRPTSLLLQCVEAGLVTATPDTNKPNVRPDLIVHAPRLHTVISVLVFKGGRQAGPILIQIPVIQQTRRVVNRKPENIVELANTPSVRANLMLHQLTPQKRSDLVTTRQPGLI